MGEGRPPTHTLFGEKYVKMKEMDPVGGGWDPPMNSVGLYGTYGTKYSSHYSSDIHTPKHNYDVINIADVTVTV